MFSSFYKRPCGDVTREWVESPSSIFKHLVHFNSGFLKTVPQFKGVVNSYI